MYDGAKVLQPENDDQIYRMSFEEKKMLNEDEKLKSEEVQKLVKQNLDKGESRHKKLGIKQIVFGARACSCGSTVTNR